MNTRRPTRGAPYGFSLIELLVSMVIALVVTLAITAVLTRSESSKRSTTSVNDVNQTGAYLAYAMDRSIRSAGSGFGQNWASAVGCVIDASQDGKSILPLPTALPDPFATVPLRVRLAPVLIGKGMADSGGEVRGDVLTVMSGTSGASDMPQTVLPGSVTATAARVTNTLGYLNNDLVLLADSGLDGGRPGCMLQQVAPTGTIAVDQLDFSDAQYSRSNGSVFSLTSFGGSSIAIQVGSAPANPPQMVMYGVGANNTLYTYDMLRLAGFDTPPAPLADGVVEMRALYGIDTTVPATIPMDTTATTVVPAGGRIGAWIDPGKVGSGYTQAELTDGTLDAQQRLRRIVAIRVGLILRTSLQERESERYYGSTAPTDTTLTLFGDLDDAALHQTRTISGADNLYRYRTFEFTVPLRNALYAPYP